MSLPPFSSQSNLNKRHKPCSYHDKENAPPNPLSLSPNNVSQAFHRTHVGHHVSSKVSGVSEENIENPSPSCTQSRLLSSSLPYPLFQTSDNVSQAFHRTFGGHRISSKIYGFSEENIENPSPRFSSQSSSIESRVISSSLPYPAFHQTLGGHDLSPKISGFSEENIENPSLSCTSHLSSIESTVLSSYPLSQTCGDFGQAFHQTPGGHDFSRKVSGFSEENLEKPSPRWKSKSNSIESRLLSSSSSYEAFHRTPGVRHISREEEEEEELVSCTQLDMLIKMCSSEEEFIPQEEACGEDESMLKCPLCGVDISQWDEEARMFHANACLDEVHDPSEAPNVVPQKQKVPSQSDHKVSVQSLSSDVNVTPVIEWLHSLGLGKYEAAFIQQEIDWDSLQWLTEEDLITIGVTALGPRKKIMQCLKELGKKGNISTEVANDEPEDTVDTTKKPAANRLITEFFSSPPFSKKKIPTGSKKPQTERTQSASRQQKVVGKNARTSKNKVVPLWCCIPGTPFRVDAFQYLRSDCSHWFLTHFHIDHYQGLTRSFAYGKIYCSKITAKLVNAKIGIPWERLQVLPLNEKINIGGVDITCYDANHCPGSIVILFEPRNGKPVLHTGDFRFNEELAEIFATQACSVYTLILDTTYCNPQYNFPKQESVIQFVIEAIQAESFNQKTLFLIGSYTIGKERLFLEVARVLRKKIYVAAAKLRLLDCLDLPAEDRQWLTPNERETHIHVVPMWTIASFKRLKQLSHQYSERFSLIVAFSPTGWAFSKGKKSAGRRWQQGTIIRYEVPYSEHCSFEELKEFVKLVSPVEIIPSVNNEGAQSSNDMLALLQS